MDFVWPSRGNFCSFGCSQIIRRGWMSACVGSAMIIIVVLGSAAAGGRLGGQFKAGRRMFGFHFCPRCSINWTRRTIEKSARFAFSSCLKSAGSPRWSPQGKPERQRHRARNNNLVAGSPSSEGAANKDQAAQPIPWPPLLPLR